MVDDLAFLRSVATEPINHAPAKLFANTGSQQFGRPSMGSWVTYGIGSEAQRPARASSSSSPARGARAAGRSTGATGSCPSTYQGVPLRNGAEPILDLANPPGIDDARQRRALDAIRDLNAERLAATGDPEIAARIASYEMAYRMQSSAPELIDLAGESKATLDLYGAEPGKPSFANNCLLARRLVERGVRFVQLYHTNWDHHGGPGEDLGARPRQGLPRGRPALRRPDPRPEGARPARLDPGRLGRRVRPDADGRDPRATSAGTTTSTPSRCGWPAAASRPGDLARRRPTTSASPPSRAAPTSTTSRPRSSTSSASTTPG